MRKPLILALLCLVFGTACNWWTAAYTDGYGRKWSRIGNVGQADEKGRCRETPDGSASDLCWVRQSKLVNGCIWDEVPNPDVKIWCVGEPAPYPTVVVNY